MIHSPERSHKHFAYFQEHCKLEFTDCSYKNDLSDSIYNEEHKLTVFFPNSDTYDPGRELFNTFAIRFEEPMTQRQEDLLFWQWSTAKELVDFIHQELKL